MVCNISVQYIVNETKAVTYEQNQDDRIAPCSAFERSTDIV